MSKIDLNFFGERISIENPTNLDTLRKEISRLFCFSPQDTAEILLTYNENGKKLVISNDEELKAFLNSKVKVIDLDISQNSKIYKDNLNQLQEESLQDKKTLEELLKRNIELETMKDTQFKKERDALKEIHAKMVKLAKKKKEVRQKIKEGVVKLEKEKRENLKKIAEIQKKLGIPVTVNNKEEKKNKVCKVKKVVVKKKVVKHVPSNKIVIKKKPVEIKLAKTERTESPKEKNKELELKLNTIDDWGKCVMTKTQEITNKLVEKFKEFPMFTFTANTEEDKKENENEKKEQVIHRLVICDGCGMNPLIGKRYKCKGCKNFDYCEKCYEKNKETHKHEFHLIEKPQVTIRPVKNNKLRAENKPKKIEHCPTMGNIFEKENASDKIMHFGVKCDGCGAFPIVGCRFKCAICDNFDYCEECEKKLSEKHNHPFLKIYEPKMNPLFFKCLTKKQN